MLYNKGRGRSIDLEECLVWIHTIRYRFDSDILYTKKSIFNYYMVFTDYISQVKFTSFILSVHGVIFRTSMIKLRSLIRDLWERRTR